ncbi:MAG: antibiotic biosynthesis monooxygenase family protein [Saccharomonospora viridis]|uniref:antibiotic biosynthesis monooxygenase family protein n=1 Tax=Saccharomonospora viridis TaxID=1852 RepID=UPI0024099339|nr:antibiotic biosynthesis monooxygenase [Saccharomonospora viridis]
MITEGIILIDAWELPEDRIDESVARWRERVGLIHTAPGFRSARLHRRLSRKSRLGLVNVAHWDDIEARDRALSHPGFVASAATAAGYATVHGGWYHVAAEVRSTRVGSGEGSGITVIEAVQLPAERVDEAVSRWLGRAESMSDLPGHQDNRLHRAVDADTRFQLVDIARWDSLEAWGAANDDPRLRQRLPDFPDFAAVDTAAFQVVAEF